MIIYTYLFSYFSGIVTIDVPLDNLEPNQCPQPFYVANAFKNTARCHTKSTKVDECCIIYYIFIARTEYTISESVDKITTVKTKQKK